MNKKKQTPLSVLKELEPFIDKIGDNFTSEDPENFLLRFKDKEPDSDFYFYVEQYQTKDSFKLLINYKPYDQNTVEKNRVWIKGSDLNKYFSTWINFLQSYEEVKSPFDDPITESFQEDYFAEFEIVDDDKDKPLNPHQILLLDEYFEKVEEKIEKRTTKENSEKILEIKDDISELRDNLTTKTKFWIISKICWIWAKMTKLGPKFMKDFIDESNKQIVKEGVKKLMEFGKDVVG